LYLSFLMGAKKIFFKRRQGEEKMKIRLPKKLFGGRTFKSLAEAIEYLKSELKQEPLFPTEKYTLNQKLLKRLELLRTASEEKLERGRRAVREAAEKLGFLKKELKTLEGLPNWKQIGRMLDLDISFIDASLLNLKNPDFKKHGSALREVRHFFKQGSSSIEKTMTAIDNFLKLANYM